MFSQQLCEIDRNSHSQLEILINAHGNWLCGLTAAGFGRSTRLEVQAYCIQVSPFWVAISVVKRRTKVNSYLQKY